VPEGCHDSSMSGRERPSSSKRGEELKAWGDSNTEGKDPILTRSAKKRRGTAMASAKKKKITFSKRGEKPTEGKMK